MATFHWHCAVLGALGVGMNLYRFEWPIPVVSQYSCQRLDYLSARECCPAVGMANERVLLVLAVVPIMTWLTSFLYFGDAEFFCEPSDVMLSARIGRNRCSTLGIWWAHEEINPDFLQGNPGRHRPTYWLETTLAYPARPALKWFALCHCVSAGRAES